MKQLRVFGVSRAIVWTIATFSGLAAQATTKSEQKPFTIVAFGDSITALRGNLRVYPALIEEELTARGRKIRVVNAGIGGNTTEQAKSRFEKDVLAHEPDVVVVCQVCTQSGTRRGRCVGRRLFGVSDVRQPAGTFGRQPAVGRHASQRCRTDAAD